MNKNISLNWEFFATEKDAIKEFDKIDKLEEDIDIEDKASTIFKDSFSEFKKDKNLKWDEAQPLVIKWEVRINSKTDIEDVVIDNDVSVVASFNNYMEEEDHFDYTILDEIINLIKSTLIDSYENLIPFNFNELLVMFVNESDDEFGFDIYQLNAVGSSDGETFIIDAKSAIKNNVFESIKEEFESRIEIKN